MESKVPHVVQGELGGGDPLGREHRLRVHVPALELLGEVVGHARLQLPGDEPRGDLAVEVVLQAPPGAELHLPRLARHPVVVGVDDPTRGAHVPAALVRILVRHGGGIANLGLERVPGHAVPVDHLAAPRREPTRRRRLHVAQERLARSAASSAPTAPVRIRRGDAARGLTPPAPQRTTRGDATRGPAAAAVHGAVRVGIVVAGSAVSRVHAAG
mmetsp:Transcript_1026/g.2734  ORF Transcript_1026/g.2734 Transcript_1026/m.2734 type:complete len:214 (-) Transcript_1026:781-1422(-)